MTTTEQLPKESLAFPDYYDAKRQLVNNRLNLYVTDLAVHADLAPKVFQAIEECLVKRERPKPKRLRPVLAHLVHDLVGGVSPAISQIAIVPEVAHAASLIRDDQDDNDMYRGEDRSIHAKYGNEVANEAFEFLTTNEPYRLLDTPEPLLPEGSIDKLYLHYSNFDRTIRDGQKKDVDWSQNQVIPSVDQYLEVCREKTASTFELAVYIGTVTAGASSEQTQVLIEAVRKAAIAFQLRDDLLDLDPNNKTFGNDILKKKVTLPIVFASETKKHQDLDEQFFEGEQDAKKMRRIYEILLNTGSIERTKEVAMRLIGDSLYDMSNYFASSPYLEIVNAFLRYNLDRKI